MYEVALSNAKLAGDSSKARRVDRGVKVSNRARFQSAFDLTQACFYDTLSVKLLFSAGRRFVICSRKHSLAEQLMRMKSRLQWLLGAELQNQTRRHHVSFMVCVEILSKFVNDDFASQTITVSSATCTCVSCRNSKLVDQCYCS